MNHFVCKVVSIACKQCNTQRINANGYIPFIIASLISNVSKTLHPNVLECLSSFKAHPGDQAADDYDIVSADSSVAGPEEATTGADMTGSRGRHQLSLWASREEGFKMR